MKLTLCISPCPNDTFMFDALINGRIDTEGLGFDVRFADIEQLNRQVITGIAPDIGKISYAVLPEIVRNYALLDSGSALGRGNGPILVARAGTDPDSIKTVAVPGTHTTANMLVLRLFPHLTDRRPMLFSDIAGAVSRGEVDAGVLIHEGRFTYRLHGLEAICDLGTEWERTTGGLPLPLGAIVAKRSLEPEIRAKTERLIRRSVEFAFAHPEVSRTFVKSHAREMDDRVIDSHIALFVNRNSLTLDPEARRAIQTLTGLEPERL